MIFCQVLYGKKFSVCISGCRELDERKTFDLCSLSYKAAENKNERSLLKF